MKYKPDDIPYDLAYEAYRGISFSPEKRAEAEQNGYIEHMNAMVQKYGHLPGAEAELEKYRDGYIKRYCAYLSAKSRVISPMTAGPAKFPYERNQKNMDIEHKRRTEFLEWKERAIDALERNLGLKQSRAVISSDDPDALKKLNERLVELRILCGSEKRRQTTPGQRDTGHC